MEVRINKCKSLRNKNTRQDSYDAGSWRWPRDMQQKDTRSRSAPRRGEHGNDTSLVKHEEEAHNHQLPCDADPQAKDFGRSRTAVEQIGPPFEISLEAQLCA